MLSVSSPSDSRRSKSLLRHSYVGLVITFCTVLFCAAQSFSAITFTQTEIASGDTSSNSIVSGDFDNDGVLDLVTFNVTTISFYKGLGGGKFASPVNTASTQTPLLQGAAADFNGDGKLDLAVASFYGSVSIFRGNGDGTFTFARTVGPGTR
jgi:hypothetical protein